MNSSQESSFIIPCADDTSSVNSQYNKMNVTTSSTTIRYDYIIDDSADLNGTHLATSGFLSRGVRNLTSKRIRPEVSDLNYELQQAHRILTDLMSDANKGINHPFMDPVNTDEYNKSDYYEVIKKPMWLKKVQEKLIQKDYCTIAEVVADIRLVLENCYRYYGPDSHFTKKGLKLEQVLEQKLALLPRELRDKTTLEITAGREFEDIIATQRRSTRQNLGYSSILLFQVKHEKAERDRELKRKQTEERKAAKEEKQKEVLDWEATLLKEPLKTQMKAMWELPLIGHFFFLCQTILNMPEVSQFELERILVMPRASSLLHKIMTSLLSNPHQRASLDRKPPMPYRVWQSRLQNRIQSWYKILQARENRGDLVFMQLGIEADFFKILGPENPLNTSKFHELSFHQRVWCIKGLCDYILYNHRTVQEALNEQVIDDMREYSLGHDRKGNVYLHFPQFCGQDLRIYRQKKCTGLPSPKHWGAVSAKKRKQQAIDNSSEPDQKKSKHEAPSDVAEPIDTSLTTQDDESKDKDQPTPPITTRRSLRLSKVKLEVEQSEMDGYCSSSTDESYDSDQSESDDEYSLEPNIASFEMVVDSVESLRTFMEHFKPNEANENSRYKKNKTQSRRKCEVDLYERLNNLLMELEPWEVKLQKAQQKALNRLKREWEEFEDKEEEIEDVWGSDQESEVEGHKSSIGSSASSECSDYNNSLNEFSTPRVQRPTRVLRSQQKSCEKEKPPELEISTEELLRQVNDSIEYPTRGKLKQLRTSGIPTEPMSIKVRTRRSNVVPPSPLPPLTPTLNGIHQDKCETVRCSSNQNITTSHAKKLYAWETLRQILVPLSTPKGLDAQVNDLVISKSTICSTPRKFPVYKRLTTESLPTCERDNLHHVKMDMLGAMQAATSLAKKVESPTKHNFQPIIKSEDEDTFGKLSMSLIPSVQQSEVHGSKGNSQTDSTRSSNVQILKNGNLLLSALTTGFPKVMTKESVNCSFNTEGKKLNSSSQSQWLANQSTQIKQHIQSLQASLGTPKSSKIGSNLRNASQVLIPLVGEDGKTVVYRLNCSSGVSKITNAQLGSSSQQSSIPFRPVASPNLLYPQKSNTTNRTQPSVPVVCTTSGTHLKSLHNEQTPKHAASSAFNVINSDTAFQRNLGSELNKDLVQPYDPSLSLQKQLESQKVTPVPVSSGNLAKVVSASSVSTLSSVPEQRAVEIPTNVQRVTSILQPQHPPQPQISTQAKKALAVVPNHINVGQQQLLLVPITNQNGKTTYLQIPTQSSLATSPEQSTSMTVSSTATSSLAKGTMDPPVSAPQRLIPALSPRRQMVNAFPRKIAVTKPPPPLVPLMTRTLPTSKANAKLSTSITSTKSISKESVMLPVSSTSNFTRSNIKPSLVSTFDISSSSTTGLQQNTPAVGTTIGIPSTVHSTNMSQPRLEQASFNSLPNYQASSNSLPSHQSSECLTSDINIAVTGNPEATSSEAPIGPSSSLTNANIVSLISNNPTLASIIQKYVQKGHRVVIMQQGDNLVFQALPSQVGSTTSTVDPTNNASSTVCQSNTLVPSQQVAENVASVSSEAQPVLTQSAENQSSVCQVQIPATHNGEANIEESLTPHPPSAVAQTSSQVLVTKEMEKVNHCSDSSAAAAATTATTCSSTLKKEVGGKLVILQDSVSNQQTYGLLLDNGQVIPLNVTIS